jgi:hypothetical protein
LHRHKLIGSFPAFKVTIAGNGIFSSGVAEGKVSESRAIWYKCNGERAIFVSNSRKSAITKEAIRKAES